MKFLAKFNAVAVRNAERDVIGVFFLSCCIAEAASEAASSYKLKQGFSIKVVTERAKSSVQEQFAQAANFSSRSAFRAGVAEFNNRVNLDAVASGITQETMVFFGGSKFVFSALIDYWKAGFMQVSVRVFEAAQRGYLNFSPDHVLGMCEEMEREFNQVLAGLKVKKYGPPVSLDRGPTPSERPSSTNEEQNPAKSNSWEGYDPNMWNRTGRE